MLSRVNVGAPVLETGHIIKAPNFTLGDVLRALPSLATEELVSIVSHSIDTFSQIPFSTMAADMYLIGPPVSTKYPANFEKGYAAGRYLESSCADTKPVLGFCTWELIANKVGENLGRIERLVDEFCLQTEAVRKKHDDTFEHVFLFDDGLIDDITVNGLYRAGVDPHKIEQLLAKLKSEDISPGFWFSPIKIYPGSEIEKQHTDWLVKDEAGKNLSYGYWDCGVMEDKFTSKNIPKYFKNSFKSAQYVLDITKPEVQKMQLDKIKGMYDKGFRYLKMDFLYMMYNKAVKDPLVVDVAFEEFIGNIRKDCPDLRLMACSAPSHLVHLFEDTRIGPDLAPSLAKTTIKDFKSSAQAKLFEGFLQHINKENYPNVLRAFLPKAALPAHPDFNALILPEHGLEPSQVQSLHDLMSLVSRISKRAPNFIMGDDLEKVKPRQVMDFVGKVYGL